LNLDYYYSLTFTLYSGGRVCLKDLSEFYCCLAICPEFFYQLSQICHNIQLLKIFFEEFISKKLVDLISAQQNLKYLYLYQICYRRDLNTNTLNTLLLEKIPNTVVKLNIYDDMMMLYRYHLLVI